MPVPVHGGVRHALRALAGPRGRDGPGGALHQTPLWLRVGLGRPPCQHGDLPQTALKTCMWLSLFNRHISAYRRVLPFTVSSRRSSTDCTCTWLHVAVTRVKALQQTPSSAMHRVNTEIFHRLHNTCTWLKEYIAAACVTWLCVAVACVRALQQTPFWLCVGLGRLRCQHEDLPQTACARGCMLLWHVVRALQQTPGSVVQNVRTEIFHRLHVHVVACGCGMCQSSSPDTRLQRLNTEV